MRMLASVGRIDQTKVRTGQLDDEDWARLSPTSGGCCWRREDGIDDSSWPHPLTEFAPVPAGWRGQQRHQHDHGGLPATDAGAGAV